MGMRKLGSGELDVSAIGLGCMSMSFGYGPPADTKRHRLDENLAAAAIQLTADDRGEIDRAASEITLHGARYPEHLQQMIGR